MLKDQIDLLSVFNAHGVECVVTGNSPDQFFLLGAEPNRVDILQGIPGVSTEDVWRDSVVGELDRISVRSITLDHLVTNKLAAGRHKDLDDVDQLRKFQGKRSV